MQRLILSKLIVGMLIVGKLMVGRPIEAGMLNSLDWPTRGDTLNQGDKQNSGKASQLFCAPSCGVCICLNVLS